MNMRYSKGTTTVEFAIVAALLFTMIFGVFEVGRGYYTYAMIDEATGRRVTEGGVQYPFLEGTVPESSGLKEGQVDIQDFSGEL